MRAQDLEADRIKISSKQGAGFIARRATKYGKKSLLREFFGLGRIWNPPPEESKDRVFIAREQFAERLNRSPGKRDHQLLVSLGGRVYPVGIFGRFAHGTFFGLRV